MYFSRSLWLALIFCVIGVAAVSAAGNSFIVADLRVDLPEVYLSRDYRVHLAAWDKPSTGNPDDFTAAWLGVFLAQYNGQPFSGQFSQVGLQTMRRGIRWFVYAEPTVTCLEGFQPDPYHCYGSYGQFVNLYQWHIVELVKYPQDNFWIARVYDANGTAHDVAKIWSTSNRIYMAHSDTEEGYYETTDPYITAKFYHWHPQYMDWERGWQDWPCSTGGTGNSTIWASPESICPTHYGATPNMFGDERAWFAGTGGTVCFWLLFPCYHLFLPLILKP
jgi:hypothetical protein